MVAQRTKGTISHVWKEERNQKQCGMVKKIARRTNEQCFGDIPAVMSKVMNTEKGLHNMSKFSESRIAHTSFPDFRMYKWDDMVVRTELVQNDQGMLFSKPCLCCDKDCTFN